VGNPLLSSAFPSSPLRGSPPPRKCIPGQVMLEDESQRNATSRCLACYIRERSPIHGGYGTWSAAVRSWMTVTDPS
jgi:hypothetical protein